MKKIMMMLLMATVALTASSQNTLRDNGTFTLQPKVGLALGSFSGDYTKPAGDANDWFGIALGLNYAQQGWKVDGNTLKLDYLNVPLVADFYVARGLALKTGVQFGFLMNAKADEGDIKNSCEKFNFSIPVGISYEISNFVLDIRYNIALTKVNKYDGGHNEKNRSDLVQFTVGYKFEL